MTLVIRITTHMLQRIRRLHVRRNLYRSILHPPAKDQKWNRKALSHFYADMTSAEEIPQLYDSFVMKLDIEDSPSAELPLANIYDC